MRRINGNDLIRFVTQNNNNEIPLHNSLLQATFEYNKIIT